MIINVKGRNIQIDDKLVEEHETLYHEPVNENLLIAYLFSEYQADWESKIQNASDKELQNVIEKCLRFEE